MRPAWLARPIIFRSFPLEPAATARTDDGRPPNELLRRFRLDVDRIEDIGGFTDNRSCSLARLVALGEADQCVDLGPRRDGACKPRGDRGDAGALGERN